MFSHRLKTARKAKKLKGRELADMLDISYSTYTKYESTDRRPDIDMLVRIADVLDVTTDYLLGRTDRPEIHVIDNPPEFAGLGAERLSRSGDAPYTPDQIAAITDAVLQEMEKRTK